MVAVITGNGLGLDNTSLQKLGGTSGGAAQVGQGKGAGYVNLATGNLVLQGSDEGLVFAGTQLSFIRTYNSQGQLAGQDWLFPGHRHRQWHGQHRWQFGGADR